MTAQIKGTEKTRKHNKRTAKVKMANGAKFTKRIHTIQVNAVITKTMERIVRNMLATGNSMKTLHQ